MQIAEILKNLVSPRHPGTYDIRQLECEEAIEPAYLRATEYVDTTDVYLNDLIDLVAEDALAHGFNAEEIGRALLELARIHGHQLWAPLE